MGGNADAPAEQHPDEPEIAGVAVEIERGEQAHHKHIGTEMDEKSARSVISGHDLNSFTSAANLDHHNARLCRQVYGLSPLRRLRI